MSDIFVSYASEDLERVKPLVTVLEEQGWSVWWDRELVAGPSYEDKIEEALDAASCVVVVWSARSIQSQWVRTEAHEGMERNVLVPLLVDDVKPPLAYRIAQTARMFDWPDQAGEFQTIIDGIADLLGNFTDSDQGTKKEEDSIAVLPFVNMSNDPNQEYFSDGIAEDILNGLVRHTRMKVVARTSSFQFKGKNQDIREIGTKLDVTHILEGSVRKSDNRIRVVAQLIKVTDGSHLWSNSYDRVLDDVFAVQDDITGKIIQALNTELLGVASSPQSTENIEAHSAFLMGQFHSDRMHYEQAIQSYEEAIDLDSNYADAYAGLAYAHFSRAAWGHTTTVRYDKSRDLLINALEIDEGHVSARSLQAYFTYWVDRDYQKAINDFDSLIRIHPSNSDLYLKYGSVLKNLHQYESAVRLFDQGLKLDPLSGVLHADKAETLAYLQRYDEAHDAYQAAERMGGHSSVMIAWVFLVQDNAKGIQSQLDRGKEDGWGFGSEYYHLYQATIAYMQGNEDEVKTILNTLKNESHYQHMPGLKLRMALLERNVDVALSFFEQGLEEVFQDVAFYTHPVPIDHMTEFFTHPEYQRILKRVSLDDESIAKLKFPPLPF